MTTSDTSWVLITGASSGFGEEFATRYAVEKVGVSQDDVTLMMYAIPLENMSFGGGKLVSDIDLSMPWVNK